MLQPTCHILFLASHTHKYLLSGHFLYNLANLKLAGEQSRSNILGFSQEQRVPAKGFPKKQNAVILSPAKVIYENVLRCHGVRSSGHTNRTSEQRWSNFLKTSTRALMNPQEKAKGVQVNKERTNPGFRSFIRTSHFLDALSSTVHLRTTGSCGY